MSQICLILEHRETVDFVKKILLSEKEHQIKDQATNHAVNQSINHSKHARRTYWPILALFYYRSYYFLAPSEKYQKCKIYLRLNEYISLATPEISKTNSADIDRRAPPVAGATLTQPLGQ